MLVIKEVARRKIRGVITRAKRDESGAELVQIAIGLFLTAFMAAVLFAAVRQVWPGVVDSAVRGFADLFSG